MKNNKFLVRFCTLPSDVYTMKQWEACIDYQRRVCDWLKKNIDEEEGFPRWQFQYNNHRFLIPDVAGDYDDFVVNLYHSVYIFDERFRSAFILTFGTVEWT